MPGGARLTPRVDGNPFTEEEWEDIARALAHVAEPGGALLRFMWANDARSGRGILGRLHGFLIGEGAHNAPALADLAMRVFVAPPLCPACAGRGHVERDSLVVDCGMCATTGMLSATPARLALAMGVTIEDWLKTHQGPFDGALAVLQRWQSDAMRDLSRCLSEA